MKTSKIIQDRKKKFNLKTLKCKIVEKSATPFAGILPVAKLVHKMKLQELIEDILTIKKRNRGYTDAELCLSLSYATLSGADCLDDLSLFREDKIFQKVTGVPIPHPTTTGNYLRRSTQGHRKQFLKILKELYVRSFNYMPYDKRIIVDVDSSIFETTGKKKQGADWAYNKKFGFNPHFAFLGEIGFVLNGKLRRGNAYASSGALSFLGETRKTILSAEISLKILWRMDSAYYDKSIVFLIDEKWKDKFIITACHTDTLMKKVYSIPERTWKPYKRNERGKIVSWVAEFHYQPTGWGKAYRFIVKREIYQSGNENQWEIFDGKIYTYPLVIVTNMQGCARSIMRLYEKKGNSENFIKELKDGFSLERLPCQNYEANQSYLMIGLIAYNLFVLSKYLLLKKHFWKICVKTFRLWYLLGVGYITSHSREITFNIVSRGRVWKILFNGFLQSSFLLDFR